MSFLKIQSNFDDREEFTIIESPSLTRDQLWETYLKHGGFHGEVLEVGDYYMVRVRQVHSPFDCVTLIDTLTFHDEYPIEGSQDD